MTIAAFQNVAAPPRRTAPGEGIVEKYAFPPVADILGDVAGNVVMIGTPAKRLSTNFVGKPACA